MCSEKAYDPSEFDGRVERFPFDDHNAPPFTIFIPFCRSVDEWLKQHPDNVCVIHCKAGKGRTGVMICAYMCYDGTQETAEKSLEFYAMRRTYDLQGVTIASQRRYVFYFDKYLKLKCNYPMPHQHLILKEVILHNAPKNLSALKYKIKDRFGRDLIECTGKNDRDKNNRIVLPGTPHMRLSADIKFVFKEMGFGKGKKDVFHFWMNTYFVENGALLLKRREIDRVL